MTILRLIEDRTGVTLAAAICVMSALGAAHALFGAVRREPLPFAEPPAEFTTGATRANVLDPDLDLDQIVENDPFDSAPLADEGETLAASVGADSDTACLLLGTVVSPGGDSFGVCDLRGTVRSVRAGDTIGRWKVLSISQGRIRVRSDSGESMDLTVVRDTGSPQ